MSIPSICISPWLFCSMRHHKPLRLISLISLMRVCIILFWIRSSLLFSLKLLRPNWASLPLCGLRIYGRLDLIPLPQTRPRNCFRLTRRSDSIQAFPLFPLVACASLALGYRSNRDVVLLANSKHPFRVTPLLFYHTNPQGSSNFRH